MLGGYQIIDLQSKPLTTEGVKIDGAFKKASTGKALLIEHLNVEGDIIGGAFGYALISNDLISIAVATVTLTVDANDIVKIVE